MSERPPKGAESAPPTGSEPPPAPEVPAEAPPEPGAPRKKPRERVLWNTAAIMLAKISSDVLQLFAAFKMARHLGDTLFGLYGYLLTAMEVFRVLTNFGIDVVSIRTVAVSRYHPRHVVRHLVGFKAALTGAGLVAVYVVSLVMPKYAENRFLLLLLALSLFPSNLMASITVRFQAEHFMDRLIPVQAFGGALFLGLVYLGAHLGWQVPGMVGIYVAVQLVNALLTEGVARVTWPLSAEGKVPRGINWEIIRSIFWDGLPVGLLTLIVVLYSRLAIWLLEVYGDMASVGRYFVAIKASEPLLHLAGALSISAFPVLSRLVERRDVAALSRRFWTYSVRSAALSSGVALAMTLAARPALSLIKPEYALATGALIALSWATAFMFQNQLSTTVINAFGKYHYVTCFAAFNLLVFLALSTTLIPRYGATGAGLSTLGTEGINTLVQIVTVMVLIRRLRRSLEREG